MAGVSQWSHEGTKLSDFCEFVFFFFFWGGGGGDHLPYWINTGLLDQYRLDESLRDIMYMPAVMTSYGRAMIHNLHRFLPFQTTVHSPP